MQRFVPFVFIFVVGFVLYLWMRRNDRLDGPRAWTLALGLGFFTLTEIGRTFLRPYIYTHHPQHPLFANTLGNSLGTLAAIFMVLAIVGETRRKDTALIALVTFGLVAYELSNSLSGHPVDPQDIAATLIFGGVAFGLYLLIHRRESSD